MISDKDHILKLLGFDPATVVLEWDSPLEGFIEDYRAVRADFLGEWSHLAEEYNAGRVSQFWYHKRGKELEESLEDETADIAQAAQIAMGVVDDDD